MRVEEAVIELPALDVRAMGRLVAAAAAGLERLWHSEQLRSLLDDPGGRRAMELCERARVAVMAQWADAVSRGVERFDLSVPIPRDDLDVVIPFVRRVCELLGDGSAMESVGAAPLSPHELRLIHQFLGSAERAGALSAGRRENDEVMTFESRPIDVARMGEAISRGVEAFELLWNGGRLRALLRSAEGREALGLLEEIRAAVVGQWAEAAARGRKQVAIRITLPRRSAQTMIGLARKLFTLVSDPDTMAGVGGEALPPGDIDLLSRIIEPAKRAASGSSPADPIRLS